MHLSTFFLAIGVLLDYEQIASRHYRMVTWNKQRTHIFTSVPLNLRGELIDVCNELLRVASDPLIIVHKQISFEGMFCRNGFFCSCEIVNSWSIVAKNIWIIVKSLFGGNFFYYPRFD